MLDLSRVFSQAQKAGGNAKSLSNPRFYGELMQIRLECPICESRFETEENLSSISICPECNREFETELAIVPVDQKPKRETLILPEEVTKRASDSPPSRLSSILPSPSGRTAPALDGHQAQVELAAETITENLVKPPKRRFTRKPRKFIPVTIILILVAVAIGLLVCLPYALKMGEKLASDQVDPKSSVLLADDVSSSLVENATEQEKKTPTSISTSSTSELDENIVDVGTSGDLAVQKKKREPKPAPPGKHAFFSQQKIDDCWRQNQARIVRLEITNAFGSHRALATIVDSRGWIATSFRAVEGATKIKVIQTTRSFEQFASLEPLTDLCKGVLMIDPGHDLAVLAINRRFVIEISDLKIAQDDLVLGTDKLVQFCIFDDDMPMTTRETQVVGRPRFPDLIDVDRQVFERARLNTNDIRWIQHTNTEGAVPGAPLFTIDGELVGINSENPNKTMGYAFHTSRLVEMIREIPFDSKTGGGKTPLALNSLTSDPQQAGNATRNPQIAVDEASPARDTSVDFNLAGKACADFNWQPNNEEQYQAIQEFAKQMIGLNARAVELAAEQDSPSFQKELHERDTLLLQIKNWQQEMMNVLSSSPPRTEATMLELNQWASAAIQKTNLETDDNPYHVAYVKLALTAMDSPRRRTGVETITLEILGSNEYLNVPYDDRFPSMLPETVWLTILVITENGKLQFKDVGSNEVHEAKQADVAMIQGPLK